MRVTAINIRKFEKNTLQAFFDIEMEGFITILGCTLHRKNESYWIGLPAKSYEDKDGATKWQPVIEIPAERMAKLRDLLMPELKSALEATEPAPMPSGSVRTGRDGDAGQNVGTYAKKGAWAATAKPVATQNGWACGDVPNDKLDDVTFSSRELDMLVPIGTEPDDEF